MQTYPIRTLICDVEAKTGHRFVENEWQLFFEDQPVEESIFGVEMTLKDYKIEKEDTLFVKSVGFTFVIENPKVCTCITSGIDFFMACTGVFFSIILALKEV